MKKPMKVAAAVFVAAGLTFACIPGGMPQWRNRIASAKGR